MSKNWQLCISGRAEYSVGAKAQTGTQVKLLVVVGLVCFGFFQGQNCLKGSLWRWSMDTWLELTRTERNIFKIYLYEVWLINSQDRNVLCSLHWEKKGRSREQVDFYLVGDGTKKQLERLLLLLPLNVIVSEEMDPCLVVPNSWGSWARTLYFVLGSRVVFNAEHRMLNLCSPLLLAPARKVLAPVQTSANKTSETVTAASEHIINSKETLKGSFLTRKSCCQVI